MTVPIPIGAYMVASMSSVVYKLLLWRLACPVAVQSCKVPEGVSSIVENHSTNQMAALPKYLRYSLSLHGLLQTPPTTTTHRDFVNSGEPHSGGASSSKRARHRQIPPTHFQFCSIPPKSRIKKTSQLTYLLFVVAYISTIEAICEVTQKYESGCIILSRISENIPNKIDLSNVSGKDVFRMN